MIGFVKWLICQYKTYKIEKTFERNDDDKEKAFINLFSQCRDYGFTEGQMLYILNLVKECEWE